MLKKEKINVVLMHGKNTNTHEKWYPWLKHIMQELKIDFIAPELPNADDPHIEEWTSELDKIEININTILIGHSRGGVAILRWLEKQKPTKKIKKLILVATNSGFGKKTPIKSESDCGFYTETGYDFEKIKLHCNSVTVLHSIDDQWVPFADGIENSIGLSAKFLKFKNKGHFGKNISEFPELINEITI